MATITGTSGNDNLAGTSDDDIINGGDGDDSISGSHGSDTIHGGAGTDSITDNSGGDSIFGDDGTDYIEIAPHLDMVTPLLLDGGNDNDFIVFGSPQAGHVTIVGGAGSDQVLLWQVADTIDISLGSARDRLSFGFGYFTQHGDTQVAMDAITVTDFAPGNSGDVLLWLPFLGSSLIGWNQTSNPFGAGFVRLQQSGLHTLLQVDFDGAGAGYAFQTFLTLENVRKSAFTAANFSGYDPLGANPTGTTISGREVADDLTGTLGADTIKGAGGNDVIFGGAGSDRIEGGAGDDILSGEVGHDIMIGGDGDDYLDGLEGNDRVDGGAGTDRVHGGEGDDTLLGGDGDDYLRDDHGDNHFDGGAGADMIETEVFGTHTATILGGLGNDIVQLRTVSTVTVDTGAGDDAFQITDLMGVGLIDLTLGTGRDLIRFMLSQSGRASGILARDFELSTLGDRIDWGSSLTSGLIGWNGTTNPFSTGHLRLVQSGTSTLLQVDLDSDDFSYAFETIVTFAGVQPFDLLSENLGGYGLLPARNGTSGSNTMKGTAAAERLNGLAGSDRLFGYAGEDQLVGDSSDDYLDGGAGADHMFGGTGNDRYIVDNAGDRLIELAGHGNDRVESNVSFVLPINVEELILLGSGAINGTGNGAANVLVGNAAANRLFGEGGNDVINGGGGADVMKGGTGDDSYVVDSSGDQVVEDNRAGTDTIETWVNYQLPVQVERLVLGGTAALEGLGNSSDNWLYGNSGDNYLNGGSGNDRVEGGAGSDRIYGNFGNDVLVGGSGKDRFTFNTEPAPNNVDRILDFSPNDDSIYLANYVFEGLPGNGQIAPDKFREGTVSGDIFDRILYDKPSGNIFYDADGTGSAVPVLFAIVAPGTALTHTDFYSYG